MRNLFYTITSGFAILAGTAAQAQQMAADATQKVEMAEGLRSSGKIYVVVAVLLLVLAGISTYLIRLDRRISRLEKGDA